MDMAWQGLHVRICHSSIFRLTLLTKRWCWGRPLLLCFQHFHYLKPTQSLATKTIIKFNCMNVMTGIVMSNSFAFIIEIGSLCNKHFKIIIITVLSTGATKSIHFKTIDNRLLYMWNRYIMDKRLVSSVWVLQTVSIWLTYFSI